MSGQILHAQKARAHRVVDIVVDVGDAVRQVYTAALQRPGLHLAGVMLDAVAHLPGEVKAASPVFQHLHHAPALFPVLKAALDDFVKRVLARVAKGRMPQVVAHGNGLGEVLVQPQRPRQRARHLRNLQCMCQARAVMIALRRKKHLRLALQAPEGLAVQNPVPVALELRAHVVRRHGPFPAAALTRERRERAERIALPLLKHRLDGHLRRLPSC